jgi:hypothetical protein
VSRRSLLVCCVVPLVPCGAPPVYLIAPPYGFLIYTIFTYKKKNREKCLIWEWVCKKWQFENMGNVFLKIVKTKPRFYQTLTVFFFFFNYTLFICILKFLFFQKTLFETFKPNYHMTNCKFRTYRRKFKKYLPIAVPLRSKF